MGRSPCCSGEHAGLKKGPWSEKEDKQLRSCLLENHNLGWRLVPKKAGLLRCGKSCRLRWMNYLRPDIRRGNFTQEEEDLIIQLHSAVGNKWSIIATQLPGRTDNEIKNLWNTRLRKLLVLKGTNPVTHQPLCNPLFSGYVKQCIKNIENMIIAELMAPSNSYNHNSYSKSDTCSLDVSLPSFIPPLQTSGSDEVFVQPYVVNSSFDQSALEVFTSSSLVEDSGDKDMNIVDDFLMAGVSCLPANSFGDYLGSEFRDNSSGSDLIEGMDSLESVGGVNLEEGLQYWN